jgi:hypothetical protein
MRWENDLELNAFGSGTPSRAHSSTINLSLSALLVSCVPQVRRAHAGRALSGVGQSKKRRDHAAARRAEKRRDGTTADSQTPDFADMILALWMHNARKGQRQARAMKAEKTREKQKIM